MGFRPCAFQKQIFAFCVAMKAQTLRISSKCSLFSLKTCLKPGTDIVTSPTLPYRQATQDLHRPLLEAWKLSHTVFQFSKALWCFLSAVPLKFEFERLCQRISRRCMGTSCPTNDITLPLTCFQDMYGGPLRQQLVSRGRLMKLK